MLEAIIAFALGGLLLALAVTPPMTAVALGIAGAAIGVLGGVVFGIMYHVHLHRALRGELPARWWWNPTAHHPRLRPEQFRAMRPWFLGGVASFLACVLGFVFVASALLKTGG